MYQLIFTRPELITEIIWRFYEFTMIGIKPSEEAWEYTGLRINKN